MTRGADALKQSCEIFMTCRGIFLMIGRRPTDRGMVNSKGPLREEGRGTREKGGECGGIEHGQGIGVEPQGSQAGRAHRSFAGQHLP